MTQKTGLISVVKRIDTSAIDASYIDVLLSQLNESLYLFLAKLWKNDDRDRIKF